MDKYKKYNFYTALGAKPILELVTDSFKDVEDVLEAHPKWFWKIDVLW